MSQFGALFRRTVSFLCWPGLMSSRSVYTSSLQNFFASSSLAVGFWGSSSISGIYSALFAHGTRSHPFRLSNSPPLDLRNTTFSSVPHAAAMTSRRTTCPSGNTNQKSVLCQKIFADLQGRRESHSVTTSSCTCILCPASAVVFSHAAACCNRV